jgi:carbon-monoxide dehydrogenase iron sulfur subunit
MSEVEKEPAVGPKGATRRDFLKGAAVGAVGGLVVGGGAGVLVAPGKEVEVEVLKEVPVEVAVELQQAVGYVERDVDTCAGCRTCEAVCSLSHDGVVSPALARTWIVDYILEGRRIESVTCKQCQGPDCLSACPVPGALHIDETTGARVIDAEKCTSCKLCMEACPQYPDSPIRYDAKRDVYVKCDLCGGDPLCVKYCPEAALSLATREV